MFGKNESLESGRLEVGSFWEARSRIISTLFPGENKNRLESSVVTLFCSHGYILINIPVLRWRMGIQGRGEDTE